MSISLESVAAAEKYDRVRGVYECHDHRHCLAILTMDFPDLLSDVLSPRSV